MGQRIIIRSAETRRRRRQMLLVLLAGALLAMVLVPAPDRGRTSLLAQVEPSADIS